MHNTTTNKFDKNCDKELNGQNRIRKKIEALQKVTNLQARFAELDSGRAKTAVQIGLDVGKRFRAPTANNGSSPAINRSLRCDGRAGKKPQELWA